MSFRRKGGGGGGGVCTANWCDYDIFLPQKTSAGELVLVKEVFQERRRRRMVEVDVFQERRMWERRGVVDGKLSSRASVADRRRRAPDIPCGFTCLFS